MTASRYLQRSARRQLAEHEARLQGIEFSNAHACFRAWREAAVPLSIAGDGSLFTMQYNKWQNSDPAVFAEVAPAPELSQVRLQLPGVYSVYAEVTWESNTFGGPQILLINDLNDAAVATGYFDYWTTGLTLSPYATAIRSYPKTPTGDGPFGAPTGSITIAIAQNSGSSQNVDDGSSTNPTRLEIIYFGGWQDAEVETAAT